MSFTIIQGGMGVGVSSTTLANAVSRKGELGVVSGTALALTFARRLMKGAKDYVSALETFFDRHVVEKMKAKYLNKLNPDGSYKMVEMPTLKPSEDFVELMVVSTYCEVYLAKLGHLGQVGINFLEKIQMPTLYSVYGAILAGVDVILMGAGIPVRMPHVIDKLSNHEKVSLPIKVYNDTNHVELTFDPSTLNLSHIPLKRPKFFAIISSHTLANYLYKSDFGAPDAFVVEKHTAGGHNAPPRGDYLINEKGEPIYGERDEINLEAIKKVGLPFYLAGGYGNPTRYQEALAFGAEGVQVGTIFALSDESGFEPTLKKQMLKQIVEGEVDVLTDAKASPTGFPFKVANILNTMSEKDIYEQRTRICDLGYLREPYQKENGSVGYRCPSEPVEDYIKKGGKLEDTVGRKCLCNGLVSAIGLPQQRGDQKELPLITSGDEINLVRPLIKDFSYSAADVLNYIKGEATI